MSRDGSHPPALAIWLLRRLCPKNTEALTGDRLERFREGLSGGWFWRQVLIAIIVGVSTELRLHWPHICYAIAGTVMFGFLGRTISQSPVVVQLWVSSRGLQWPLSSAFHFGQTAVLGVVVLPVLAGLLLLNRAFGWVSILRAFGISLPLFVAGDLVTFLWVSSHVERIDQPAWMLNAFGISRIFSTLLVSAWLGCRLRPRLNRSGKEDVPDTH